MRHQTIDSDHAQKHGQGAKENHELRHHAVSRIRDGYQCFKWFYRRDRLIAIYRPYRFTDGRGHCGRITGCAYDESESCGWELRQGNVHLPFRPRPGVKHLDVPHHAYNRADSMLITKAQLPSHGIFIRPNLARKRLIDNHRGRTARLLIGGIKVAALHQPYLHCRKIIEGHGGVSSAASLSGARGRLTDGFDFDSLTETTVRHLTGRANSNGLGQ